MAISSNQAVASSSSNSDSAAVTAGTANPASKNMLSMDSFLKMFTTELQYQDPTNPLQSYELAAQLAQYSSVELLSKIDADITGQQTLLSSINNAQMMNLIGHQVEAAGNTIEVQDGAASGGSISLSSAAAKVTVSIYDQNNNLVRQMDMGQQNAGSFSLDWDGKNTAGNSVQDGKYTFKVEAVDEKGNTVDAITKITGTVSALRMDGSNSFLVLAGENGREMSISSVTKIYDQGSSSDGNGASGF